jgi:hypothetical protein
MRSWRRAVFICLLVAVAARIAIGTYAMRHPARFDYPDSRRYVAVAQNIAAGRGPMESNDVRCGTDPGYPILLAIAPLVGRESPAQIMNWGRQVNTALGLAAIVAAMHLARRAGGTFAAWAAGLIMALDPIFLFFHALVLTEVAFTCLMLWGCEWLLRGIETGRSSFAALSAAALGAATLTRSSALLLPLALLPAILVAWTPAQRRWSAAAMFCAMYALMLTPTAVRNYRILGAFVPVRTGLGATLLDSFGPWADGGTGMERIVWPIMPRSASEIDRERVCVRAAYDRIRDDPVHAVKLAWAKFRRTWSITLHAPGYQGGIYDAIAWATVAPIYVLAFAGAWRLTTRPVLLYALLAPLIYFTLVHCVFVGSVRYRVPMVPVLFILAGAAIAALFRRSDPEARLGETR